LCEYAVMFGTSVEEAVKRVSKWAAAYYTHPNSYYKLPTSHALPVPRKMYFSRREVNVAATF